MKSATKKTKASLISSEVKDAASQLWEARLCLPIDGKLINEENEYHGITVAEDNPQDPYFFDRYKNHMVYQSDYIESHQAERLEALTLFVPDYKNCVRRFIVYYDDQKTMKRADTWFSPDSIMYKQYGFDYKIEYLAKDPDGTIERPQRMEVYYHKEEREKSGRIKSVYNYDIDRKDLQTHSVNYLAFNEVEYTDKWAERNGYKKSILNVFDGIRTQIEYQMTEKFAQKNGYRIKRNCYTSIGIDNYFDFSGTEIEWPNNPFGGTTHEWNFKSNDYHARYLKVEKKILMYDKNGILRQCSTEGKDLNIRFFGMASVKTASAAQSSLTILMKTGASISKNRSMILKKVIYLSSI